jgi:hypothetical protein
MRRVGSCQLQVLIANTGVLMTGRAMGKDSAALDNDVFAQHTWDPLKAQSKGDAVVLRLGMSEQKFHDFNSMYPAARNLSPALFNDYTIVYNYVRNFNTFAPSTQCTSSQPFDAMHYPLTSPIKMNDLTLKFNCSVSEVFPPPPFYMLLSSSAGNESVSVTALTRITGVCQITVTRLAPLLHDQPVTKNGRDAWTCNPNYFNDSMTCDCGCGVPDPDCLVTSSIVNGCDSEQPLCDHWGKCSTYETATLPLRVFLSTPCSSLKLAGKQHSPYCGSHESFHESVQLFL